MKYCVEISEEQLRIISVAVDEYMRLRMGQFEPLTEDLVFDGEDKKQNSRQTPPFSTPVPSLHHGQESAP